MTAKKQAPRKRAPAKAKAKAKAKPAHHMSDPAMKARANETRTQGVIVRDYLDALDRRRPTPGRQADPQKLKARLEAIETRLVDASPLDRLLLHQERLTIETKLLTQRGGVPRRGRTPFLIAHAAACSMNASSTAANCSASSRALLEHRRRYGVK